MASKIKVELNCTDGGYITDTDIIYVYGDIDRIGSVLSGAREIVSKWLEDRFDEIPEEYNHCYCDNDFYRTALELNFKVEYEDYDDVLKWVY